MAKVRIELDDANEFLRQEYFFLLPIAETTRQGVTTDTKSADNSLGLVLRQVAEEKYVRVGIFRGSTCIGRDWLRRGYEFRIITII